MLPRLGDRLTSGIAPARLALIPARDPAKRRAGASSRPHPPAGFAGYGIRPVRGHRRVHPPCCGSARQTGSSSARPSASRGARRSASTRALRGEAVEGFRARPGWGRGRARPRVGAVRAPASGWPRSSTFVAVDRAMGGPPMRRRSAPGELEVVRRARARAPRRPGRDVRAPRRAGARGRPRALAAAAALSSSRSADAGFLAHQRYLPATDPALDARRSPLFGRARVARRSGRTLLLGGMTALPNLPADAGIAEVRLYDALTPRGYRRAPRRARPAERPRSRRVHDPAYPSSASTGSPSLDRDLAAETRHRPRASDPMCSGPGAPIERSIGRRASGRRRGAPRSAERAATGRSKISVPTPKRLLRSSVALPRGPARLGCRAASSSSVRRGDPEASRSRSRSRPRGRRVVLPAARPGSRSSPSTPEPCPYPLLDDSGPLRIHANPAALRAPRPPRAARRRPSSRDPGGARDSPTPRSSAPPRRDSRPARAGDGHPGGLGVLRRGWRAFAGGEEIPVRRASGGSWSVRIPEGAPAIEMRYEPASFRVGLC